MNNKPMMWQSVFNSFGQINSLLEKEDVTLQELMDEDEFLQECQSQNDKMLAFILQEHVMRELVTLTVSEPSEDLEYRVRFKYATLAAEVLSAEIPQITDKLVGSQQHLEILCSFLQQDKPLHQVLGSFFSKVIGTFLHRQKEQNYYQYQLHITRVLDFMQELPDFIMLLVRHIDSTCVLNLLYKLLCSMEEDDVRKRIHEWFAETPVIAMLLSNLGPENDWCGQANVEQLFCDVLDVCFATTNTNVNGGGGSPSNSIDNSSPNAGLASLFTSDAVIKQLMAVFCDKKGTDTSIKHSSTVILKMLSLHTCSQCDASQSASSDTGFNELCLSNVVEEALPMFHEMLLNPKKDTIKTSYNQTIERLGTTRHRIITVIRTLVATRRLNIHSSLAKLGTLSHLLDLFFRFPQNNFLHHEVTNCIVGLLTQGPLSKTDPNTVTSDETLLLEKSDTIEIVPEAAETSTEPSTKFTILPVKETSDALIPSPERTVPVVCDASVVVPAAGTEKSGSVIVESLETTPDASTSSSERLTIDVNLCNEAASCDTITSSNVWDPAAAMLETQAQSEPNASEIPDMSSHPLLVELMTSGDLLTRILTGYGCLPTDPPLPKGSLCGYRGHLRELANTVVLVLSGYGVCHTLLSTLFKDLDEDLVSKWQDFADGTLQQENAINDKKADMRDSSEQMGDSELKPEDMNNTSDENDTFESSFVGERPNVPEPSAESLENTDMFEQLCSNRNHELADMWQDHDQPITFAAGHDSESYSSDRTSSDEEGDLPQSAEMDVDDSEWDTIITRQSPVVTAVVATPPASFKQFNPWDASASPCSDTTCWGFDAFAAAGAGADDGFGANFDTKSANESVEGFFAKFDDPPTGAKADPFLTNPFADFERCTSPVKDHAEQSQKIDEEVQKLSLQQESCSIADDMEIDHDITPAAFHASAKLPEAIPEINSNIKNIQDTSSDYTGKTSSIEVADETSFSKLAEFSYISASDESSSTDYSSQNMVLEHSAGSQNAPIEKSPPTN